MRWNRGLRRAIRSDENLAPLRRRHRADQTVLTKEPMAVRRAKRKVRNKLAKLSRVRNRA